MDSPDLSRVTDRQLDAFLAVELFGMPMLYTHAAYQGDLPDLSTDPAEALRVIEAMGEKAFHWDGNGPLPYPSGEAGVSLCGGFASSFWRHSDRTEGKGDGDTFALAVARAAVAALWRESPAESRAILSPNPSRSTSPKTT